MSCTSWNRNAEQEGNLQSRLLHYKTDAFYHCDLHFKKRNPPLLTFIQYDLKLSGTAASQMFISSWCEEILYSTFFKGKILQKSLIFIPPSSPHKHVTPYLWQNWQNTVNVKSWNVQVVPQMRTLSSQATRNLVIFLRTAAEFLTQTVIHVCTRTGQRLQWRSLITWSACPNLLQFFTQGPKPTTSLSFPSRYPLAEKQLFRFIMFVIKLS